MLSAEETGRAASFESHGLFLRLQRDLNELYSWWYFDLGGINNTLFQRIRAERAAVNTTANIWTSQNQLSVILRGWNLSGFIRCGDEYMAGNDAENVTKCTFSHLLINLTINTNHRIRFMHWIKTDIYFVSLKKCKDSSSYLQLVCAAGSLLFDARHHVFLHLVQNRVKGGELRLQVLLDSVGVRLVSQQKYD